jgi:acetyl-CoA acetyltransferase
MRKLLARSHKQLSDIDIIELNEAFAVQNLSVIRELGIDQE